MDQIEMTEEKVYEMAYLNVPVEKIAKYFDCSRSHMYVHFGLVIQRAHMDRQMELRAAQFSTAKSGNATMQIWLGKNELGQLDQPLGEYEEEVTEVSFKVRRVPKPVHEEGEEE